MTLPLSAEQCRTLDSTDPVRHWRESFEIPDSVIYLDGNSLGPMPRATPARLEQAIRQEWGQGLIRSWNTAGWVDKPATVGAAIAPLIGARASEVVCADSTSLNLFKVLAAALNMRPARKVIVSEIGNFPTDLYIAQGLSRLLDQGHELRLVERDAIPAAIDESVAVVMLTQVDYRTGSRLDMADLTRQAHDAGAVMIWDLAHSAGAIPVDLNACHADFAIGCGYKYLNGGPGAPAFVFVAERHAESFTQPLSGWMGHAAPFDFDPAYRPAPGIARYLCGTPPMLSMIALQCGVDIMAAAVREHGMQVLHDKACALIDLFINTVTAGGNPHGLTLLTPAASHERGSQASFSLADGDQAYAVVQALIARGVIGDFRAPNILRFGFAPLYLSYTEVHQAALTMREVLDERSWDSPSFLTRQAVT